MKHDRPGGYPAAFLLLFLVTGLASGPHLMQPVRCAILLTLCGTLVALLRRSPRSFLYASVTALGILLMTKANSELERNRDAVASFPPSRFVEITAPIDADWRQGDRSWSLTTRSFTLAASESAERIPIVAELTIFAPEPPPIQSEAEVTVTAFVRVAHEGRFFATVKSPRLIRYHGVRRAFHPSTWNWTLHRSLRDYSVGEKGEWKRGCALASALILGRNETLPAEMVEEYKIAGIYHLLVFSGMQIALAAAFLAALLRIAGLPRTSDFALLALAVIAPLFAGGDPSVTRSATMIGVYALSRIAARPTPLENLYFLSAFIRLTVVPTDLTDAGFALTYAATGGLLFLGKPLSAAMSARSRPLAALIYGASAELATAPLTLAWFHRYALASSVITLLVSPAIVAMLIASVTASVSTLFYPELAPWSLALLETLDALVRRTGRFAAGDLGLGGSATCPPILLVSAVYAIAVAAAGSGRRSLTLLLAALLAMPTAVALNPYRSDREADVPTIEMLDVGQGDSILIRSGPTAVLIDGGGSGDLRSFGQRVLLPLLLHRGLRRLDSVILTHPHPDHSGGLRQLVSSLPVDEVWIAREHLREEEARSIVLETIAGGGSVRLFDRRRRAVAVGSLRFEALPSTFRFKRAKLNNTSLVFRVRAGRWSILLAGDAEKDRERELVFDYGNDLSSDILKVAHHGSGTSTTEAFAGSVRPRIALVSCGRENQFGHPHPRVLDELRARGSRIYRTDRHGTVRLRLTSSGIRPEWEIDTPESTAVKSHH